VVRQALGADIDLLLICHKGPAIEAAFERILAFHAAGEEGRQKAEQSLGRLLALKRRYLS
jgi:beta-N-acetylhexosaminidase